MAPHGPIIIGQPHPLVLQTLIVWARLNSWGAKSSRARICSLQTFSSLPPPPSEKRSGFQTVLQPWSKILHKTMFIIISTKNLMEKQKSTCKIYMQNKLTQLPNSTKPTFKKREMGLKLFFSAEIKGISPSSTTSLHMCCTMILASPFLRCSSTTYRLPTSPLGYCKHQPTGVSLVIPEGSRVNTPTLW